MSPRDYIKGAKSVPRGQKKCPSKVNSVVILKTITNYGKEKISKRPKRTSEAS